MCFLSRHISFSVCIPVLDERDGQARNEDAETSGRQGKSGKDAYKETRDWRPRVGEKQYKGHSLDVTDKNLADQGCVVGGG